MDKYFNLRAHYGGFKEFEPRVKYTSPDYVIRREDLNKMSLCDLKSMLPNLRYERARRYWYKIPQLSLLEVGDDNVGGDNGDHNTNDASYEDDDDDDRHYDADEEEEYSNEEDYMSEDEYEEFVETKMSRMFWEGQKTHNYHLEVQNRLKRLQLMLIDYKV
ncbi:hypothetical protein CRG98_031444 [Punica granatum]|uniref:Uncharacterized protein n=1 Tax=Punica granatum TaxID=22663 RepID=A0A2I0IVZ3_PUNGR|nr:hypothetical protein CRG98_031444 [Punica granatum]